LVITHPSAELTSAEDSIGGYSQLLRFTAKRLKKLAGGQRKATTGLQQRRVCTLTRVPET
jgi:hypothetical protein